MKKKLLCAIGALSLTASMSANSQILDHDAASFAEIMMGNQERALQHLAKMAWNKAKAEFDVFLADRQLSATERAAANMIVGLTKNNTDLYNIERLMEMVPAVSACGTSGIQGLSTESFCEEKAAERESVTRHTSRHATAGMPVKLQDEIIRETEQDHFDKCLALSGGDISDSVCSSAANLFGGASGATKDPHTQEAADSYIDLIVGVAPDKKITVEDVESMTPEQVQAYNRGLKKEAIRSLAAVSLEAINNQTRSPDADNYVPSKLHRLKSFNDQRWGNESWLRKINNTARIDPYTKKIDQSENNAVNETQLLRELVVMEAFAVQMQTLQYEQSLRDEALQAAMLSLMKDRM